MVAAKGRGPWRFWWIHFLSRELLVFVGPCRLFFSWGFPQGSPYCSPAQSYLLTFKIRIQMPLPPNIAIAIYLGKCVPTCSNRWLCQDAESICLKSSLLDCFSQGSKRLSTASQAVSNILSGETAFRQDEDNVESFSSSGSVMRLPVSTPGLVQQLLWFIQFFSSVSTGRFIDVITKQSFFQISITRWSIGRLVDESWDSLCTNDSA